MKCKEFKMAYSLSRDSEKLSWKKKFSVDITTHITESSTAAKLTSQI